MKSAFASALSKRAGLAHRPGVLHMLLTSAPKTKASKRARWLQRIGLGLIIYTVVGFFVLPAIIKWQMVKQLTALTHRTARVEAVRVNPYALSLTVRGLSLREADGATFASFSNFYANFEACSSLLNWTWTLGEVRLGSPYGYVSVLTNGQFNFANMLTNSPGTNGTVRSSQPPPLLVQSLVITNGTVAVADFYRAQPFQTQFTPIDVRLTHFTTRPRTGSPYAFTARTGEGEYFHWSGRIGAFPPASSGKFELGGIDLKKYATYLREFTQLEVREGKVTVGATYNFALETNGLEMAVTNASVLLTNLSVYAPDGTNLLVLIPSIAVRGAEADWQKRAAKVQTVETIGGALNVRRLRDGSLELLTLAAPPTNGAPSILNPPPQGGTARAASAVPASSASAAPWSVLVESITVRDYQVRATDEQPPTPARFTASEIALTVQGFSLSSNAPLTLQFSTRVNGLGTVQLAAQGTVRPVALDADLDVRAIDLRPFQPYVEQQEVKLTFTSGNVSTKGRASLALHGTNPPALKFTGDVVLDHVAVVDQIDFQDFLKWKQVAVRGIDFVLAPMSVRIHELACEDLATSVVMGTNQQLTALAVLPVHTNPAPKPAASASESLLPFPLQLDLLTLTNASIHIADLSLQPNCRFAVQQFSGTVRGLSSARGTVADVDIHGRMNESAPFSVTGKIKPLFADLSDLLVDLVITNKNTDLTAFTPYMEKFGGYPLAKGKVTVGLRYDVQQGVLKAENSIFIDQLTLGQKNNSPDATSLPVKLGVALLKDRNGRIELAVPLSGRLDDPKFKIGPIVLQVLRNMLTKVATSPFSLLGALVGGGEELSFVEFKPGQAGIGETELAKINKLGQALYERPALNLEITGTANESLDRAALAWGKLERELKSARLAELVGQPEAPSSGDAVILSSRDYERLLRAAYKKTFNRDQPLPEVGTNAVTGMVTNVAAPTLRNDSRKGAEVQKARPVVKPEDRDPPAVGTTDPRIITRPSSLPTSPAGDATLARLETELFTHVTISSADLRELMERRAQAVQRQLLKTEKVTVERLSILAPQPTDAAWKGQSRVNLSLN